MGKKSKPPKSPDYDKLLALSEKYQAENTKLAKQYLDFQTSAYADQKDINEQISGIQLPAMEDEAALAKQQRDRYREMGIPFENSYLDKITNWDTEERRNQEAGRAQADLATASEAAREAELRRLESYGIDPSQTRSAALDSRVRLQDAANRAAAGNAARTAVETQGLGLGADAVNVYRGMPTMSQASLEAATTAGQTAFANQQGLDGQFAKTFPTASNMNTAGFNMANSGYNTANNIYGNQLKRWELKQANSPWGGIGQLAGTALGAAGTAGGFGNLFSFGAEGGPVPHAAEGGVPVPGGNQPQQAGQKPAALPRPASQGLPTDNRPMFLTPGEFVIPDDVTRWEGEKNLQKIINKARTERVETEQQRAQNQASMGIPA